MREKDLPAVMALAYLGDAVYSLYVRRRLVTMGVSHAGDLNRLSLSFVTAPKQAALSKLLLPLLTEEETGNAKVLAKSALKAAMRRFGCVDDMTVLAVCVDQRK